MPSASRLQESPSTGIWMVRANRTETRNGPMRGRKETMRREEFSRPACVLAVALLSVVAHCQTQKRLTPYNIILLTSDQLSADYMRLHGSPYKDTPNLEALAARGTSFTRMYAAAPWTTPSFGVVLTGLFPTVHGMTLPPYKGRGGSISQPMAEGKSPKIPSQLLLSSRKPTLPGLLKPYGMITAADNSNRWSIWDVMDRGWDEWKFFPADQLPVAEDHGSDGFYLTAPKTTAWAQQWLTQHQNQRFFLWVHYMEPHAPFNAPDEFNKFHSAENYPNLKDSVDLHRLAKLQNIQAIRRMQELYAGRILYLDNYIGKLLATVHSLDLDKNTILIFTSNNGDPLYSHPINFNTVDQRSLYSRDLHVPFIVTGLEIPAARDVHELVSNYDIVPTILDLDHLPVSAKTHGVSLQQTIQGDAATVPYRYIFAEESNLIPQYSVRRDRYMLIETMTGGGIQLTVHKHLGQILRQAAAMKRILDEHIQSEIKQAKSYSDKPNNTGLAVLQNRDSANLQLLADKQTVVQATGGAHYQRNGRQWRMDTAMNNLWHFAYLVPSGTGKASVTYRSDTPPVGHYRISVWYSGIGDKRMHQATKANYTLVFRNGSRTVPVNQQHGQATWKSLGIFHDPASVIRTNRANGAVVAGTVRFEKIANAQGGKRWVAKELRAC